MIDTMYMRRCLQLAELGRGNVLPNPMVGAVLVYNDRIIGEGFHQQFGGPHAEVNCINSVADDDKKLIPQSTLYVSLEPCAHFGKTPPCADLIIRQKIPKVVIGCRDPFAKVDGKGIEKLKSAGILTESGILEAECQELNKRFFYFHTKGKPYVILKWAQTADGFIAAPLNDLHGNSPMADGQNNHRLKISNQYSNRLVHKWRAEEASILVGTSTALYDDPGLTTRHWAGRSPVRMILDMNLRLPARLKVFDRSVRTIVFNSIKEDEEKDLLYYRLDDNEEIGRQIANALYHLNIQSVLIEGGARLHQTFIDEELWDEARVITNKELSLQHDLKEHNGLKAPKLKDMVPKEEMTLGSDLIETFIREVPKT